MYRMCVHPIDFIYFPVAKGDLWAGGVHLAGGAVAREEQDHPDRGRLHVGQTQEAGRPEQ